MMLVDSKIDNILAQLALSENTRVLLFVSCFSFLDLCLGPPPIMQSSFACFFSGCA